MAIALGAVSLAFKLQSQSRELIADRKKSSESETNFTAKIKELENNLKQLNEEKTNLDKYLSDEKSKSAIIIRIMHEVLHETRDQICSLYDTGFHIQEESKQLNKGNPIEYNYEEIKTRLKEGFKRYLTQITNKVKKCLDLLTGNECAACVKLVDIGDDRDETGQWNGKPEFVKNGKGTYIRTLVRDSDSFSKRKGTDKDIPKFPYYKNSAFKDILEERNPKRPWYLCNDLNANPEYLNSHPGYGEIYNAVLVCPIRGVFDDRPKVTAFICADNINGNFDEDFCLQFMGGVGDHLFHIFNYYNDISAMNKELKDQLKNASTSIGA